MASTAGECGCAQFFITAINKITGIMLATYFDVDGRRVTVQRIANMCVCVRARAVRVQVNDHAINTCVFATRARVRGCR